MGSVKAVIANLLINPPQITKLGNDTMLNFGYAMQKQKPTFTFPKAKNLRENRRVAIDDKQN
jgi:nucleoside 2-deoxyribosyltransferase